MTSNLLRRLALMSSLSIASPLTFAAHVVQTNLVSDVPGLAQTLDSNLANPWGITHGPGLPWWVADNHTGVSTVYDGTGNNLGLVVTIPPAGAAPTGIVFNSTPDFTVSGQATLFLFAGEDGHITAWGIGSSATVVVDNSAAGTVYKGLAIAQQNGANRLYAANFGGGVVEVYDAAFQPVSQPPGAFTDSSLPSGFYPFNIVNINGNLFVAFAEREQGGTDEVAGAGLGYVDEFDPAGNLIMRLKHGKYMNAPWGIVLAPSNFGPWSNRLLVGQFGSGQIATFDIKHGNFHGLLREVHGKPVAIEGLWGIGFGDGGIAGPSNTLYFAAGIDDEQHGLFGSLTPSIGKSDEDEDDK